MRAKGALREQFDTYRNVKRRPNMQYFPI